MQLPHGTLVSSRRGPAGMIELGESIAKDGLTCYLRVSVFDRSSVRECVVVYMAGKPSMAFASDGSADRKDPDFRMMEEAIRDEDAVIEVCSLSDKQVKLLQELYREFAVSSMAVPAKPAPQEAPKMPAPGPKEKPRAQAMPEVRGRFVRSRSVGNLDEYVQAHPGETGHLVYLTQRNGKPEEDHIILIKGRIESAYNGGISGQGLLESLKGMPGHAEFYAVDEGLLSSVVSRHAKIAHAQEPAARVERPVPGIGIPAKELLEISRTSCVPAQEDINRAVDEISGGMEDDLAMVRRVERDFANHVDELLCKLELSHLRTRKKR